MEIESVKTWQWMLAGLFIGFAFSCVVVWGGPAFDTQDRDTMEQGEFENDSIALTKYGQLSALVRDYHKNQPMLRDVTVHPPFSNDPEHHEWVTGRAYFVGTKPVDPNKAGGPAKIYEEWRPFKYPANVPYAPGYTLREEKKLDRTDTQRQRDRNTQLSDLKHALGGRATFLTVNDYLKAVSVLSNNNFRFQYAWWELPVPKWTLPPLAGLLLIGVAWPLTLGVLQGFGLTKPMPVKAAPPPPPAPVVKPTRPIVAAPVAVANQHPQSLPTLDHNKYGGEFYPVVKATHKDE